MSSKNLDLDQLLDQTLAEIQDESMGVQAEQAAGDRVWEMVREETIRARGPEQHQIRDCSDFQALIPAYRQSALNDAKALLLEDHMRECVPCRKALKALERAERVDRRVPVKKIASSSWLSTAVWRVAAAAVVFMALVGLGVENDWFTIKAGGLVHIEAIEGDLFHVTQAGSVPVKAGDQIMLAVNDDLRTAKGSRAMLRLDDGSMVEMDARSELGVTKQNAVWNRGQKDAVIDLERGNIIIEASDQGSGHLFVDTLDTRVAVTGTIFAVNSGVKGTRVSVIEGEVHVDQTGSEEILYPGDQTTSSNDLHAVPIAEEIAWSRNAAEHLALMAELVDLGEALDQVFNPALRYTTDLLDLAPDSTVIYIGIPNLSGSMDEAHAVLQEKISSSTELRRWWDEKVVPNGGDEELERIIQKIHTWGDQLGEEIVITLQLDDEDDVRPPVVLAGLTRPDGFRAFVEQELERLQDEEELTGTVRIVETDKGAMPDLGYPGADPDSELYLWRNGERLAVTFGHQAMLDYAFEIGRGAGPKNAFKNRIRERYAEGVQWVLGVDIAQLFDHTMDEGDEPELEGFGFLDMQHLIAERAEVDGRTENRLELSFDRERRGMARWLDEPAPMGSLNFISANASLAAAFVIQEPRQLVDELFGTLSSIEDDFESSLAEFQNEIGFDIRQDFAAPLGGEVAFALDGPLVPNPSWKLILEVYDPVTLVQTLERAIEMINEEMAENGTQGFELTSSESGGRIFYTLRSLDTGYAAEFTFEDGYLIATPSRALLTKALEYKRTGNTITASGEFQSLLPADGQAHFSAVAFQNLAPMLGPLSKTLSGAAAQLGEDQRRMIEQFTSLSRPSLSVAYGEPRQISVVYTQEGGLFGSSLANMLGFRSLFDMSELLEQAGN